MERNDGQIYRDELTVQVAPTKHRRQRQRQMRTSSTSPKKILFFGPDEMITYDYENGWTDDRFYLST